MKRGMSVILLFVLFFCVISNIAYATEKTQTEKDVTGIITGMSGVHDVNLSGEGAKKVTAVANMVIKLIQIIGSGISLIVVTIMGIKYMVASANEKADIKKQAIPIIIGCVLLFAASNLAGIIADIGKGLK